MQGPGDKPVFTSEGIRAVPEAKKKAKTHGRSVTPDDPELKMPEQKRTRTSQDSMGKTVLEGSVSALSALSARERLFYSTLDTEYQQHYLALGAEGRRVLAGFSEEYRYEYFELEEDGRKVFLSLNDTEREVFLTLNTDEREEFIYDSISGRAQIYSCLNPDERTLYCGFSKGERQILSSMHRENFDIKPMLTLSTSEREAYLFLNIVAHHDGFHSLESVKNFIELDRKTGKNNYGVALLILYAVNHRHHAGAEETREYLKRAIKESGAEIKTGFKLDDMIFSIRATRPATAANFDATLRRYLLTEVEHTMMLFRQYHYEDQVIQRAFSLYEDD